jgi:hypothetical protein
VKVFKTDFKIFRLLSFGQVGQNFSFLALNTAELAVPQISFKNRRQRRGTNGKKFALNSVFEIIKSPKTLKFQKKKSASETLLSIFHMWNVKSNFIF